MTDAPETIIMINGNWWHIVNGTNNTFIIYDSKDIETIDGDPRRIQEIPDHT